jgi:hypothetical protein
MELRHLIFKRLNHFKQRVQSLSVLENQKANQHDGLVNMFINKSRGSNERVLRCLNSKSISNPTICNLSDWARLQFVILRVRKKLQLVISIVYNL